MTHLDADELDRKVKKVDALSLTQRELLLEVAGALVDLSPQALEFINDVVEQLRPHRPGPLDPGPAVVVAVAKYRDRMRKKN